MVVTSFTLTIDGLASVSITPVYYTSNITTGKCFSIYSVFIFKFVLVRPNTTPSQFGVISNYSSGLTTSSSTFTRRDSSGRFYYESIKIEVSTTGYYYIQSDASFDPFGYLYTSFDPNAPSQNIVAMNDDSAGNLQFLIYFYLQSNQIYTLIVTSASPLETGSFSILMRGTVKVNFNRLITTPSTTQTYHCTYIKIHLNSIYLLIILLFSASTSTQLKMNPILFILIPLFMCRFF